MDKISLIHKNLFELAGPVIVRWIGTSVPSKPATSRRIVELQVVVPTEAVASLIPPDMEGVRLSPLIRPETFERRQEFV